MNVIETDCPGKGYGGTWALREGTLVVPTGHVATLAGPNGAGKTTLLNLAEPLYKSLSAADMLHLTRNLTWAFDHGYARARLAGQTASGQLTASVTNAHAYLAYLAVAACCAAVVIYAVRPERGLQ
jgi:ABC-type branched-subunit amino acid transport system ATPase component